MSDKISADNLFSNTRFGLQRVYSILNKANLDGVTLKDIEAVYNNLNINDIPFAQYLYQNIGQFDSNLDNVISNSELQSKISSIESEGLTYEQLIALQGNNNGLAEANSNLSKLLEHFKEIDTNNDGKITDSEIKAYNLNQTIKEKETEFRDFKASNITIFYDDVEDTEIEEGAEN